MENEQQGGDQDEPSAAVDPIPENEKQIVQEELDAEQAAVSVEQVAVAQEESAALPPGHVVHRSFAR